MSAYLKVILKEALRYVPIFGWAAQLMLYIFLGRDREQDIPHIKRAISYLLHTDEKVVFLLFPEGTDLSPSNLQRSMEFSKEKGLREYSQVLYPRPAGFVACLRSLKGQGLSIHDLTVAYKDYPGGTRPTEKDFLWGSFPREVHIHVRRHNIDDIADDRKSIENWLHLSFLQKEEMLLLFNATGQLCDESKRIDYEERYWNNARLMLVLIVSISIGLFFSGYLRWASVIFVVICVAMRSFKGIDSVELALHGNMFISEMKRRNSNSNPMKVD